MKRIISALILTSFLGTQVSAIDFDQAVREAVAASAQTQSAPSAGAPPNRLPALVMMGAGTFTAAVGFLRPEKRAGTGVEISRSKNNNWAKGIGLTFAGVGGLWFWSLSKAGNSPSVEIGFDGVRVQQRLRW